MEKLIPNVLFESEDFVVLNKPAGMIVNNADSATAQYTVQDFIDENFQFSTLNSQIDKNSEFFRRGGIVHRLDKETSGALIVALNEKSFIALQKQFKDRTVTKEYIALVHGKLVEEGEINVPIGRLPWNRMRFGVIPSGREAYTQFKVLEYKTLNDGRNSEVLSLVNVFPKTGRTHQIRVHFQYAGYPIFSDSLYAGRKIMIQDRKLLGRHFLHASKIHFLHPVTLKEIEFVAPLPSDLVDFLDTLT